MSGGRQILLLADPLTGSSRFSQMNLQKTTLVFDEDGRFLARAQAALQQLRGDGDWVCVAGSGAAVHIALALAAQLPVERLALWPERASRPRLGRELSRIRSFARRNLSLVVSEILLVDGAEAELRRLEGGTNRHARLRCVSSGELRAADLLENWTER